MPDDGRNPGRKWSRLWVALLTPLGLAMFFFDLLSAYESTGCEWPTTPLGWLVWWIVVPIAYLVAFSALGLVVFVLFKIPPLSWLLQWVARGEDAIDRMLRVGLAALVFLVLFFVGLRLVFGPF